MNRPEVKAWRRDARQRLLAARAAIAIPVRKALAAQLAERLAPVLEARPGPVSFYWPIKGEPDLLPLMWRLDAAGVAVCLPVAIKLGEPLQFRPWREGCRMERGFWDIPVPADPTEITPRTLIAPIVAWSCEENAGWRLGYGGGFFDRTLAALGTAAEVIGVGYSLFRLPTIHPQPHDIPMGMIVTEAGNTAGASLASPACALAEAPDGYAGYAAAGEIAEALDTIRPMLPPERLPLLDLAAWRLGGSPVPTPPAEGDAAPHLDRLLPRVRDDALHANLVALRSSLIG